MEPPVLVLVTCNPDMTGYGGFPWPESGPVEPPESYPPFIGLAWGEGTTGVLNLFPDSHWLVCRVDAEAITDQGGRYVKFSRGEVVHCGDESSARSYLAANRS